MTPANNAKNDVRNGATIDVSRIATSARNPINRRVPGRSSNRPRRPSAPNRHPGRNDPRRRRNVRNRRTARRSAPRRLPTVDSVRITRSAPRKRPNVASGRTMHSGQRKRRTAINVPTTLSAPLKRRRSAPVPNVRPKFRQERVRPVRADNSRVPSRVNDRMAGLMGDRERIAPRNPASVRDRATHAMSRISGSSAANVSKAAAALLRTRPPHHRARKQSHHHPA